LDERIIPDNFNYDKMLSLRFEAKEKLKKFRPLNLAQASRINGVTSADISILMVALKK